jgi:hypothetical protein
MCSCAISTLLVVPSRFAVAKAEHLVGCRCTQMLFVCSGAISILYDFLMGYQLLDLMPNERRSW